MERERKFIKSDNSCGLSTTIGRIRREIYRRFMSRHLEDTDGNQAVPKITIEKDS